MAKYWDFRDILGVDPENDHKCVGTTKQKKRCTIVYGTNSETESIQIIKQMDHTKSYTEALASLESLAGAMLCKGQHNHERRPHLNQIGEVSRRWHAVAIAEYARVNEEAERTAKLRDELEREKEEIIAIEAASASELSTAIPAPTPTRIKVGNDSLVTATRLDVATTNRPRMAEPTGAPIGWPVTPQHRISTKIPVFSDPQQAETHPPALLETPMARNSSATTTVRKFRIPEPSFTFRGLDSAETPPFELKFGHKAGSSNATEATPTRKPRKRAALKQKHVSTHNSMLLSKNNLPSNFEFSFREALSSTSSNFEVPLKPLPVAGRASSLIVSQVCVPPIDEEIRPEVKTTQDSTKIRESTISSKVIEERPITPASKQPVSFGYAVVTPPSTRYKTYLPARQQHGLMTPPQTPENLLQAFKNSPSSPRVADFFANSFTLESSSPKAARKPHPVIPAPDALPTALENEARRTLHVDDIHQVEEANSGCLGHFGLRRVQKKLMGRMKNVKEGMPRPKGEGSNGNCA